MDQMNLFELMYDQFKIDRNKKIRLIELFAGYGSQSMALELLGIPFDHHFVCEFDKYAIDTYNAFHKTNFETSDVTKIKAEDLNIVDRNKYTYLLFYSFPCTDLSLAGKRQGMEKGSGTRSGLLWEVERLLIELNGNLPQVLIMENVPQVISANGWKEWCYFLESLGYKNYCEILNAKDYYIPQNRQRAFMVSILGDYSYNFPRKMKLKYRLKDFLEPKVDEKYYLSEKQIIQISNWKAQQDPLKNIDKEKVICPTLTARGAGLDHSGMILINEATIKGYAEAHEGDGIYINRPHQKRGVVQKGMIQTIKTQPDDIGVVVKEEYIGTYEYSKSEKFMNNKDRFQLNNNISSTLLASGHNADGFVEDNLEPRVIGGIGEKKSNGGTQWYQQDRVYSGDGIDMCHPANLPGGSYNYQFGLRIRKLTPRECFRLMGVTDDYIDRVRVSNAQQYKQAGNSIVVTVLMAIFGKLLDVDYESKIKEIYNK